MTHMPAFGGCLAALWLIHMTGDWVLQNDWMAANKSKVPWIRAVHVTVYTACYVPILWWCPVWLAWVWATHFWIDSYKPLMAYRKMLKDPTAQTVEEFRAAFGTPRGFVLYVTLDQVFHAITLAPLAWWLAVKL